MYNISNYTNVFVNATDPDDNETESYFTSPVVVVVVVVESYFTSPDSNFVAFKHKCTLAARLASELLIQINSPHCRVL